MRQWALSHTTQRTLGQSAWWHRTVGKAESLWGLWTPRWLPPPDTCDSAGPVGGAEKVLVPRRLRLGWPGGSGSVPARACPLLVEGDSVVTAAQR